MFKSKPKPEPTLAERHANAAFRSGMALDIFRTAEADLRDAAAEHDAVVADVESQIDKLMELRDDAERAADDALSTASKIANLLGS